MIASSAWFGSGKGSCQKRKKKGSVLGIDTRGIHFCFGYISRLDERVLPRIKSDYKWQINVSTGQK